MTPYHSKSMKDFAIFKVKERKSENSPEYVITLKVGDKYEYVGGCWVKEGKNGKFFSCKLSDAYQDRKGYSITPDVKEEKVDDLDSSQIPF